ncbi:MAG: GTPase [Sulfolobales archaeon]
MSSYRNLGAGKVLLVIKREERKYLAEAIALLETLGLREPIVHYVKKPSHRYYIQENYVKIFSTNGLEKPSLIVIYDKLRPWQHYNLSRELRDVEIWDIVTLILKIFELHAGTLEAKLKIELLNIRHQIPLVKEYVRLSKLGEQAGPMGAGAYGYEALLTSLRRKAVRIARRLEEIKYKRELQTINRSRLGIPMISIIGYASAGKTTLYNKLSGDHKLTGPGFFKTLSPKSGLVETMCGNMIVTDTIGFIRKMPEEIIDVFHAVISEIRFSDQIILVTDLTDPVEDYIEKLLVSIDVLKKINAIEKPLIILLNKKDLVPPSVAEEYKKLTLNIIAEEKVSSLKALVVASALRGDGLEELLLSLCRNTDLSKRI